MTPKLAAAGYSVLVVVNGSKDMPPFGALLDDEQVSGGRQLRGLPFRQLLPRYRLVRRREIGASLNDSGQPGPADRMSAKFCRHGGAAGGGKTVGLILGPLRKVSRSQTSPRYFPKHDASDYRYRSIYPMRG
jgi:hypothetical protein